MKWKHHIRTSENTKIFHKTLTQIFPQCGFSLWKIKLLSQKINLIT